MKKRDHYSFSQLNMLLRCGEQYRRRYIEGDVVPPGGNLARGKHAHKTCEVQFKQKIETRETLPSAQMVDLFSDEWEKGKYEIALTEDELAGRSVTAALGMFKDSGVRLVRAFHSEVAPTIDPAHVEDKFTISFEEEGIPDLIGIIDLADVADVIYDEKFSGKSPSADDILYDVQMTTYDLGYRVKYKKRPSALRKVTTVDLKSGPKIVTQETTPRDDATLWRSLNRLKKAHEAIQAGNFLPAPNGVWWCSPKFCGYFATCKVRP